MIDRRVLLGLMAAGLAARSLAAGAAEGDPAKPGAGFGKDTGHVAPLPGPGTVVSRIAFGSCNDQRLAQGFWEVILAQDPQLLLMLGDNVYGDVTSAQMTELKQAYAQLAAEPGFQQLRAKVPVLAIWDDHDYGANDAGSDFPYKRESAAIFRDFWGVPADSPRGQRDGLYDAWMFGPPGRRLQILMPDLRFFRSPLKPTDERGASGRERYLPDPDAAKTLLGEEQWAWLAERLREPADLRLFVSSIQVLPEGHGWERWGNLPHERERLIGLIAETGAGGIVILSGDRHFGALYERTAETPYALTEITASSFNRPFRDAREQDPLQQGDLYREANFGMVRIDWPARTVGLELHADDGTLLRQQMVSIEALRG